MYVVTGSLATPQRLERPLQRIESLMEPNQENQRPFTGMNQLLSIDQSMHILLLISSLQILSRIAKTAARVFELP